MFQHCWRLHKNSVCFMFCWPWLKSAWEPLGLQAWWFTVDAPQDVKGPCMIIKKRCLLVQVFVEAFLRNKSISADNQSCWKKVENKSHGRFCLGLFLVYLFSLIFLNVLDDTDYMKPSQVGSVQWIKDSLLFSLWLKFLLSNNDC